MFKIPNGDDRPDSYVSFGNISKLNFRKIEIKLYVAYLATAGMKLRKATPGVATSNNQNDFGYQEMWTHIHSYYETQGLDEMSDRAIKKLYVERDVEKLIKLRELANLWPNDSHDQIL